MNTYKYVLGYYYDKATVWCLRTLRRLRPTIAYLLEKLGEASFTSAFVATFVAQDVKLAQAELFLLGCVFVFIARKIKL